MRTKFKIVINAPVVIGFVALCFAATLAGILTGGYSSRLLFQTFHSSLASPLTYVRFFTHVLGHSGWSHFMGNASYILLLSAGELHLLSGNCPAGSQRSGFCIYHFDIFYRFPFRGDPADIPADSSDFYWSTDLRRSFYQR